MRDTSDVKQSTNINADVLKPWLNGQHPSNIMYWALLRHVVHVGLFHDFLNVGI